ncbi:hypothetical protein BVU17_05995 [Haloarcula taiwanensis]|uniref:Uncharacterized protein n=1 Tax=Haloarcula taiwanensis TaxID=1932004 RepID=A0A2H4ZX85_9EURY|nr:MULTISPECIES: hypothetical protein [Haloarcula]AUG47099.1 hypothetical protein BVU17_05995 [Haloarcula taiwanensis]RLM33344.1 hypothetical protein DVK01_16895 [Haloarcula sp. Atlit-120R]RLM42256.1 hypothetical protein DVK00_17840 [Haloarcula sp. Atlit-47R]RLM95616.1 hypothetical protein D3D01_12995 [Haloarcula sp. Atlit-7R]
MTTTRVAVPRKGRPLEAVLERLAGRTGTTELVDDIISTLRYEKAVTKGNQDAVADVYHRISDYSSLDEPYRPEYTLLRDDRDGMPRRIVFDSVTIPTAYGDVQLVGREEPFRALRTHEFALGFDSADLVLEEVVQLRDDPLTAIHEINDRIDPLDTDVRVVTGLGDTVYHTLLATPDVIDAQDGPLDRAFVTNYEGDLCISPRYERLVEAVLGTSALDGVSFTYPTEGGEEEEDIAATGIGVYLTVTGSTARDHGLELGERLFPSETVLLENAHERTETTEQVASLFEDPEETALQSV